MKGYFIHDVSDCGGKFVVAKILRQYDSEEEALQDIIKLGTGERKEKQLLKEYEEQVEKEFNCK
ncbi:MAG: hypothetical protein ACLTDM_18790 [Clostridium butyricum]